MSNSSRTWRFFVALAVFAGVLSGCGKVTEDQGNANEPPGVATQDQGTETARVQGALPSRVAVASPRLAFVPNGADPFWDIAKAGVKKAGKDLNCHVEVKTPNGLEDQNRIIEDLITLDFDGIAISPIDGVNQAQLINEACKSRFILTHDSDAANSNRICYIGMDNYEAGRLCGQLVKEAIPDGGKVMIFIGRLSQANSRLRRQGVIDELLGRSNDATRYDKPGSLPKEGKYVVLGTKTDGFDNAKAKANAEDTLSRHPNVAAMVGLFAYNPPMILEALRGAGKLGKVKVIGFDEQAATLQAIKDGTVHGTIVQDPYMYGYESMKVLAALARGDTSLIPEGRFQNINGRQIREDNVDQFWTELKARLAAANK